MTANHNEITAGLWLQYAWYRHEGPDPATWRSADEWDAQKKEETAAWQSLMAEIRRLAPRLEPTANRLHERFSLTPLAREQRTRRWAVPQSTWPGWYEASDMIAMALGAPDPLRMNNMWWHDRHHYPLATIESAAELARLKVPEWPRVECVQRLLDSRERWQRAHPAEPAPGFGIVWENLAVPGRGEVSTICYPSYVDLGLRLMGATQFMTILGGEPELADAFMELCFELSTSYTEFLLSLHPEPFKGLCGFGGDATFFLSPKLYERYSASWDARLFDYVRAQHNLPAGVPCNLHSCGASSHLYDNWGQHPCRANITAMQTRLISGTVGRLRAALPATELELTLHPPQFELASAEPAAIREILRQAVADAGGRNAHFNFITTVQRPEELPRLARNIAVVLEEMEALHSHRCQ